MEEKTKDEFYSDYHKSLTDNLNHISDDLLRAKWFFLATIAALGTAYMKVYDSTHGEIKMWSFLIICLIGNIIFWFISEYTLSHAFLFRFIQARMAKIEKMFELKGNTKDPSDDITFVRNDRLVIDNIIPDQFVPIYWASTWLIIINSIIGFILQTHYDPSKVVFQLWSYAIDERLLYCALISVPFIWKLWTYYGYKLDKFINENCEFRIVLDRHDYYFKFTFYQSFIPCFLVIAIYLALIFCLKITAFDTHTFLFYAIIGYFWPVPLGLIIHFLRTILRVDLNKIFTPKVSMENGNYKVLLSPWLRLFSVLYTIT
jgi:hypothetical protein